MSRSAPQKTSGGLARLGVLALSIGAAAGIALARPGAAFAASPREHYLLHCSGCHGADGRGAPGVTPSLHDLASWLATPAGRETLGRIPGVAQAPLDDAELAALLNWVLREFSEQPLLAPYAVSEIHALRAAPLRDPNAMIQASALR